MKTTRYILLATLLAATLLLVAACGGGGGEKGGKTDPYTPDAVVSVSFKTPTVEAAKGSQFISIKANGNWKLTSSVTWLTVNNAEGSGNFTASVNYDENTSSSPRQATIILVCSGKTATATLTQKGKESTPVVVISEWLELPAIQTGAGHKFVSHNFTGKNLRSFSYDWNATDQVANWVAYPLNKGLIGSGNRTDNWDYDPKMSSSEQPTLFSGYKGSYDRGHQLPSADRLTYAENVKTFYFTNMTPQMNAFNGKIWATAESMVRGWSTTCDTLYVVTGCITKGSSKKAYDNNGKAVTVPVAYYKAVLRYKKNSTIGYSDFMGLAMYFEHKAYSFSNIDKTKTDIVMSIDALEAKIGLDLFPNLEKVAGKSVSDQVEAEDPTKVSYWW
ncbi:MAG: DNA/RNA non-specific endonuclease [Bacteroidales bacterium]|nr:DNA/RNA non-specific endonuclease [Bacteroidales bacterium]